MKKCPFCAEEIQDEAVKCRFCNEFFDGRSQSSPQKKVPVYYSPMAMIVGFFCVGPLMLPLVWFHPKMSFNVKMVVTAVVLVATIFLVAASVKAVGQLKTYFDMLKGIY